MKRLLAVVTLLAATPALGAPVTLPSDTIIAARQSTYFLSGIVFGGLKQAVTSGAEVKPLADNAAAIAEWASIVTTMFPPGTDKGHDTKALAAVWTDRAGFEKDAAAYVTASKSLAAAAKAGDKAAFAVAFKQTGKACGACHKAYRQKDED